MTKKAYYNEHDPAAAAWLRELIKAGQIMDGEVDERSIVDVRPDDVRGFTQCHFFAGIGGWSYALRLAGWPDDQPVWTGSPPCQPFSVAGKQRGKADERHLAPHFVSLVRACRPPMLFGEQVASADVFGKSASGAGKRAAGPPQWAWLDDLQDRLEAARYAIGAVDFPSASVGAPHIRQRTYFGAVRLADPASSRHQSREGHGGIRHANLGAGPTAEQRGAIRATGGLADPASPRHSETGQHERGSSQLPARSAEHGGVVRPAHAADGFWDAADWLYCRDGKWRPVEPGTFPLAHGVPARVGRLRGYGNAIVPQAAAAFIVSFVAASSHDEESPLQRM